MGVDLVLRGRVRTGDPLAPVARGVAVHAGRVVALDEAALDLAGSADETVDLDGGTVLPGFGDGHVHPLWGGVELAGPDVRDATSVAEVVDAVRRYAAEQPERDWITGGPYDPTLAPHGLFDAAWLDEAVADRPVVLQSTDHHCVWVNSEAMRRAGIDRATADPPAGTVARRPDGSPLGTFVEWSAMDLVERHAPPVTPAEKRAGLAASTAMLASAGITWAQEAALAPEDVEVYLDVAAAGELSVRVNIALRAEPGSWPAQRGEFAAARASAAGVARLRAGVGAHRQVLRRRRHRGGDGRAARAVRRRAGQLRAAGVAPGRAEGCGVGVRRGRLPAAHPRHRRRGRTGCAGRRRAHRPGQRTAGPAPGHRPHPARPPLRPGAVRGARGHRQLRAAVDPARPAADRPHHPADRTRARAPGSTRWRRCCAAAPCCRWAATGRSAPTGRWRGSRSP